MRTGMDIIIKCEQFEENFEKSDEREKNLKKENWGVKYYR